MKVFLGNSPWNKKGYYGVRAGSRWPHFEDERNEYMPFPFFLAYAAAVLEEAQHDVLLLDGIAEALSEKEFIDRITTFGPELILLEVSTISIEVDLRIAKKLKKLTGKDSWIAFCGLHAFMSDQDFLEKHPYLDYALIGEYEYTLRDLANHLEKGLKVDEMPGLILKDAHGRVVANPRRPLIASLDDLPWPARHHLPMKSYHDEPGSIPRPSVQMLASRGCPFRCVFCAWPQIIYGSHKYRTRDPIDVVDEFEWLVKICGFESVYFDDDTFNIGRRRILKICEELKRRQLNVPWAAMCRADTMTADLLDAMVESGLYAVKYGVETADQEMLLKACGKSLDLRKLKETVRLTHSLGVRSHLTFMFGLPGETAETAQRTIDLALELNPESVQFSIATPFPGSRFYDLLKQKRMITCSDFSKYDGFRSAVIRTDALDSRKLEEIAERANFLWRDHVSTRKPFHAVMNTNIDDSVTVIVPSFNGQAFLEPCLDALVHQTKANQEIIVVDNGSTDGSPDFVRSRYPGIRLITLPTNTGFAEAVNHGIKQAKGSFIAVLNNDAVPALDWLEVLSKFLCEYPNIAFCASKIVKMDDPSIIDSAGHGITRSGYTFNIGNGVKDSERFNVRRRVFGAPAAAAIYRKSMLDDIGLFDEQFCMYLEDLDLSFRAQLWGYKCMYVPEALVRHVGAGTTGRQYHKKNVYHIARNTVYVVSKNMPRQILKSSFLRSLGFLFYMQIYHAFRTFHLWSCLKGLYKGFKDFREMLMKRKRILGGKRIQDEHMDYLLRICEQEYLRFNKGR